MPIENRRIILKLGSGNDYLIFLEAKPLIENDSFKYSLSSKQVANDLKIGIQKTVTDTEFDLRSYRYSIEGKTKL